MIMKKKNMDLLLVPAAALADLYEFWVTKRQILLKSDDM